MTNDRPPPRLSGEQSVKAIRAFNKIMADMDAREVRDERDLPHPKAMMINVFLAAIATTTDAGARRSLMCGYLQLAQFLPDIGVAVRDPLTAKANLRKVETLMASADGHGLNRFLHTLGRHPASKRHGRLMPSVVAEMERLNDIYTDVFGDVA